MPLSSPYHRVTFGGNSTSGGAGYALISTGTLTLAGGNNITLSQAGNAVTISGAAGGVISMWPVQPEQMSYSATIGSGASAATQTTVTAWVFPMAIPAALNFNNIRIPISISLSASASSLQYTFQVGASFGLYTLNVSSMSLCTSWSNNMTYSLQSNGNSTSQKVTLSMNYGGSLTSLTTEHASAISNVNVSFSGSKMIPFMWTSNSASLPAGQYFGVFAMSALTVASTGNATLQSVGMVSKTYGLPPEPIKSTNSATAAWPFFGFATLVNSNTQLMPNSFNTSKISSTGTQTTDSINQSVWVQFFTQ